MEPVVFLNGEFVPASQASIQIFDFGIVLGATFTEFTRTFRGRPFRLEDHLDRLHRSLKYGGITLAMTADELRAHTLELIERNAALLPDGGDLGVVHFVTPGVNAVYAGSAAKAGPMTPTVCIHSFPLPFAVWRDLFREGARVVTPSVRHIPPQCLDPKTKNRSRLHWWLAEQEVRARDPKAVPLLLDLDGNLTECSGSNFVIVEGDTIVSPARRNILWGISLETVRELAPGLGMRFEERELQVYDAVNAGEAWLTTTPYCLAPVTHFNGIAIGDGRPGPRFRQMVEAWSRLAGLDIEAQVTGLMPA